VPAPAQYTKKDDDLNICTPSLVESSGYTRSKDALKWKDIELYMVKHPDQRGSLFAVT
jgi:hypothetical protein